MKSISPRREGAGSARRIEAVADGMDLIGPTPHMALAGLDHGRTQAGGVERELVLPMLPATMRSSSASQFFRLGRLFLPIDDGFDQRRLWRTQRGLNGGLDVVGLFAAECVGAACLRKAHEIDRRKGA